MILFVARRQLLSLAGIFYGLMGLVAYAWAYFDDRSLWWFDARPSLDTLIESAVVGGGFALVVHIYSRLTAHRFKWSKELMSWFYAHLGHIGLFDVTILALLSGFAEELLFRGAMQPVFGLGPTTLLFALMHWPPDRRLISWTISAGVIGLFLGVMVQWYGTLIPAVLGHVGVNFLNLAYLRSRPEFRDQFYSED